MAITDFLGGRDPYGNAGGYGNVPTNMAMTHAAGGSLPGAPDISLQTPYNLGSYRKDATTAGVNEEFARQRASLTQLSIVGSRGTGVFGGNIFEPYTVPGALNPTIPYDLQAIYARREMENAKQSMMAGIKDIGVTGAAAILPFLPGMGVVGGIGGALALTGAFGGLQDFVHQQQQGAQNIMAISRIFATTGKDVDPEISLGLTKKAAQMMNMKFQLGGYGPSRTLFKKEDYEAILLAGAKAGLFERAGGDFGKVDAQMGNLASMVAGTLPFTESRDPTAVANMLGTFSRHGVDLQSREGPANAFGTFARLMASANLSGRSIEDLYRQEYAYGSMLFASKGMLPSAGGLHSVGNAAAVELAMKKGLLDQTTVGRMGGKQGLRQAMDVVGANAEEMVQKDLIKFFENERGELDYGKIEDFKRSGKLPFANYHEARTYLAQMSFKQGIEGTLRSEMNAAANSDILRKSLGGSLFPVARNMSMLMGEALGNASNVRDRKIQEYLGMKLSGLGAGISSPTDAMVAADLQGRTDLQKTYSDRVAHEGGRVAGQIRANVQVGEGYFKKLSTWFDQTVYTVKNGVTGAGPSPESGGLVPPDITNPLRDMFGPSGESGKAQPAAQPDLSVRFPFLNLDRLSESKASPPAGRPVPKTAEGEPSFLGKVFEGAAGAAKTAWGALSSVFSATPAMAATLDAYKTRAAAAATLDRSYLVQKGGADWRRAADSAPRRESLVEEQARRIANPRGPYYEEQKPGEDTTLNIPADGQLGFLSQWRETGKDGSRSVSMDTNGYSSYGLSQLNTAPGNSMGTFVNWLKETGRTDVLSLFDSAKNSDGSYDWRGENSKFAQIWRENTQDPNSPLSRADREFMGHYLEGSYKQLEHMGFDQDTMQRLRSSPTFREVAMAMTRQGPTAALMRNLTNAYAVRHGMPTGKPWDSYSDEQKRDMVREYSAMDIPQLVSTITTERSRLNSAGTRLAYWERTSDPKIHRSLMAAFAKENAIFDAAARMEAQGKFKINADGSYGYSPDFASAVQKAGLTARLPRPGSEEAYVEGNDAAPGSVNDYDSKRALADELMQASMSEGRVRSTDTKKENAMTLAEINPELVIRAEAAMKELREDYGYADAGYSSTYRTADEQSNLHARLGSKAAKEGSNHQRGLAFDFTVGKNLDGMSTAEYSRIQSVFAKYGLYTPLSHLPGERQHIEMRQQGSKVFGGTQATLQAAYDRLGKGAAPKANGAHYRDDYAVNPKDGSAYGKGGGNPRTGEAERRAPAYPQWLGGEGEGRRSVLKDKRALDAYQEALDLDRLSDETFRGYLPQNMHASQDKFVPIKDRNEIPFSDISGMAGYYAKGTVVADLGVEGMDKEDKEQSQTYGSIYGKSEYQGARRGLSKLPVLFENFKNLKHLKAEDFANGKEGLEAYTARVKEESISYMVNSLGMSESEADRTFKEIKDMKGLFYTNGNYTEEGLQSAWRKFQKKLNISFEDFSKLANIGAYSSGKVLAAADGSGGKVLRGTLAERRAAERDSNLIGRDAQGGYYDGNNKARFAEQNLLNWERSLAWRGALVGAGAPSADKAYQWLNHFHRLSAEEKKGSIKRLEAYIQANKSDPQKLQAAENLMKRLKVAAAPPERQGPLARRNFPGGQGSAVVGYNSGGSNLTREQIREGMGLLAEISKTLKDIFNKDSNPQSGNRPAAKTSERR